MNEQQNLTEFWDDSISLEEPDFWDNVAKEPETVSELLGKDFLYHATYKPYWEEIKKDGYIKPGKHTNWDNRYKTTGAIYLATDYDNAVYYAKNAENVPKELLNQIVILKIDADKLDVDQLDADSNQIYDSDDDEGRSIEDPYTWKEVQYYKPIPVNAVVKVYDKSIIKESINKNMDEMLKESDLGESFYEDENKESLNEVYPQKGETKSDFINRFMRVTGSEYPDVKQRYAVANSYWERRDKKRLKESEDHTQKAIDALGITYYKTRAGFMLKDGRMLDLTYGGNPREDHRAIQDAFDDMDLETASDYLVEFMNEGNIRLIPELPGIDIVKEPTAQQQKALKDYIQFWINHERHFEVQYSNEKGQQIGWKEYNGYYSVDSIIEDLLNHFSLTEAYLDPEKRFWDYRTGQISGNKLFDITRSESSYGQSFLDGLGKSDSKGRVGRIVEMSPTEYFKACAKGFGSSYAAQINQIKADKDTYQLLSDVIDKYNRQFPITYLDYSKGFAQEGRHRMYIAGERFGWNTKFPVLVIEAEESPLFELKENRDPSHKERYVVTVNKNRALIYGNNKRDLMYKLSLIEDNISEEYFETIWKIIRNSNIG